MTRQENEEPLTTHNNDRQAIDALKGCYKDGNTARRLSLSRSLLIISHVFILIMMLSVFMLSVFGEAYTVSKEARELPREEYIAKCQKYRYSTLQKNAESLKNSKITLTGKINQVVYESDIGKRESKYKVTTQYEGCGIYDDDIILYFTREYTKIRDGDIITIYGEILGPETYKTFTGARITVPAIKGVYINVHPEAINTWNEDVIEYTSVTMDELSDALEKNALNAKESYQNNYFAVTGRLSNIDSDGSYIALVDINDKWCFNFIQCYIKSDEQLNTVRKLKIDQVITVKGKITKVDEVMGYSMDIDSITL